MDSSQIVVFCQKYRQKKLSRNEMYNFLYNIIGTGYIKKYLKNSKNKYDVEQEYWIGVIAGIERADLNMPGSCLYYIRQSGKNAVLSYIRKNIKRTAFRVCSKCGKMYGVKENNSKHYCKCGNDLKSEELRYPIDIQHAENKTYSVDLIAKIDLNIKYKMLLEKLEETDKLILHNFVAESKSIKEISKQLGIKNHYTNNRLVRIKKQAAELKRKGY